MNALLVGLGGAFGAVSRYFLGLFPLHSGGFPFTTLLINFLGALLIGVFSTIPSIFPNTNSQLILLLTTGLCGGFTTFSTFSLETVKLFESGKTTWGICYILFSVILCIAAVLIGRALIKFLFS